MLDVEDWRFPAEHRSGKSPPIMSDQKERPTWFQGTISVTANSQRVAQVFDRLKTSDQPKTLRSEGICLKHFLADQGPYVRRRRFNRSTGWLDANHTTKTSAQQFAQE